jgi:hypothetical protein
VYDEKLKDSTNVANIFNSFLITITEKLNIQQIKTRDAVSILRDLLASNFPGIKIIPIT